MSDQPPTPDASGTGPTPGIPPDAAPKDNTPRGKAAIVSFAIMCSRVLGLIREVILGGIFRGSAWMDAFMVAYRTPNMLRDLFAEGALSTAFVTTFSKKIKTEGDESAWDLARKVVTLVAIFMSILTIVGILIAPLLVKIMAWGWDNEQQIQLTVLLARIIYGFIALISLAALVMGMLNSKGVFFIPAISSSFFNIGSIASGALIGYWIDPDWGPNSLIGFAIGVLIGGLFQLGIQIPSLFKIGFRFRPDFGWKDPAVKKVLTLMGPAVIAGSAVQAGVLLNTFFASFLDTGSISYLQWSFRLMMMPIGVFGVAVATVTLPAVSRAATEGIGDEFRMILSRGIRLAFMLTIPSAVGLYMLAEPIISLIWDRWNWTEEDTHNTAASLRYYAIGLAFYAGIKVIQPAFYAVDRKWVPMFVSLLAILINAILNSLWVFVFKLGHEFLALSTAVGAVVNFTVLYILMRQAAGHFHTRKLISTLVRLAIACAVMGTVVFAGQHYLLVEWSNLGFALKTTYLLITIAVAAIAFFSMAKLLRVEEMDEFVAVLKRRVKKS